MTHYFSQSGFNPNDITTLDPREYKDADLMPEGTIFRLPKGVDIYVMHVYLDKPWQQIKVVDLAHHHASAAGAGVSDFAVTFSGGAPSAIPGWHNTFATRPPFDEEFYSQPGVVFSDKFSQDPDPMAGRRLEHEDRIKALIKPLRGWSTDSTVGESRTMGGSWLEVFQCVEALPFSTTYRLVVRSPWMD